MWICSFSHKSISEVRRECLGHVGVPVHPIFVQQGWNQGSAQATQALTMCSQSTQKYRLAWTTWKKTMPHQTSDVLYSGVARSLCKQVHQDPHTGSEGRCPCTFIHKDHTLLSSIASYIKACRADVQSIKILTTAHSLSADTHWSAHNTPWLHHPARVLLCSHKTPTKRWQKLFTVN